MTIRTVKLGVVALVATFAFTARAADTCTQLSNDITKAKESVQNAMAAAAKCPVQDRPICESHVRAQQEGLTALEGQYLKQCEGPISYNPPLNGTATPKWFVLTLIYAPPGNQSQVTYGSGSTTGSKTDITFQQVANVELAVETSFLRTDFQFGGGKGNGSSFEVKKTTENILQGTSQRDPLDHGEDTFLIWTNPQINLNLVTNQQGTLKVGGVLGADAVMVRLTANQLKNPALITDPATLAALSAFQPSDYQAILNLDPFFFYSAPVTDDPARLSLTAKSVQIIGPDEDGGFVVGQGNKLSNETTNSTTKKTIQDDEATVMGGYEWDTGAKVAIFAGIHMSQEWDTDSEKSTGAIQEAQYLLQSNTPKIQAAYDVYYDTLFKTFAFVPLKPFLIPFTGSVHSHYVKGQPVMATFKNGSERIIPVNVKTGEFTIVGDPSDLKTITYGAKNVVVTDKLIKKKRITF